MKVEPTDADTSGELAVLATNVAKKLGDTQALKNASLAASFGEIHAIVGENGSGKSTLGKLIAGIYSSDSGSIRVLQSSPRSPRRSRQSGIEVVLQEVILVESASVVENLFLGRDGLFRSSLSGREKRARATELMERLAGSPIDVDMAAAQYPLNVQQWMVIGRALLTDPKVLVLDESSAALDADGARRLYRIAKELARSGTCVITVTHRIDEIVGIADKATVLRDGSTVGVLEKDGITEKALLSLMSGRDIAGRSSGGQRVVDRSGVRLRTSDLRLVDGVNDGIDMSVAPGEILGIAALEGHGGLGLVRRLAGIGRSSGGRVTVGREQDEVVVESVSDAVNGGIAYIPGNRQAEGIFPNLSIVENFGMALYKHYRRGGWIDTRRVRSEFSRKAQELNLRYGYQSDPIGSLSGGNQQKILIARALAQNPRVLVLGDPNRGVDIPTKEEVFRLLTKIAEQGVSVVFYSTEIDELCAVSDRVLVLRDHLVFGEYLKHDLDSRTILDAMFGATTGSGPAIMNGSVGL